MNVGGNKVCFRNTEFKVPERHPDKNINGVAGNLSLKEIRKEKVWCDF